MDMVNPILEFASRLWNSIAGYVSYIIDRKEYVTSLRMKTEELKAINNDVKSKVELGEQNGMKRTEQVQLWFTRVEETQNNVNMILQQNVQLINDTSTCFIIKCHCWSAYEFAKNAAKTLNTVTEQISEGRSFHEPVIPQPVLPTRSETKGLCIMPMEDPVGIESDFQTIWEKLEDDEVGKIGLYGIGGVGKTTILKQINNELFRRRNYVFDVAIWVVASLKATEEAIQQAILQKLEIPTEKWGNTIDDNATLVYQKLEGIKFVLMLDDVWESLDLLRLGIPRPNYQNKSKIIFTTGSKVVCSSMKADWTIEIKCLPQEKALSLFLRNVGEAALASHHEIHQLARWVAGECKGLPLALVTVGRAMACKNTTKEWSHALLQLRKYPFEFPVVGKYVLPVLKFNYDSLVDSITKECFVYCALFPRGYEIASDGLVDLWMGEGYLNENCVKKARNHGFSIIEDLKHACLLQSGTIMPSWVKMHDVIREMALWIASDYGEHNNKFRILEEPELLKVQNNIQDWNKDIEKMSLWSDKLPSTHFYTSKNAIVDKFNNSTICVCPQVSTLVVQFSQYYGSLGWKLFKFGPCLRVLDLSTRVFLESTISPEELKGIAGLINLEFLNLSRLPILELPEECKRLSKLKYLLMDEMKLLKECPTEVIVGLEELIVFRMDNGPMYRENFLRGLENLQKLQETSINLTSIDLMNIFLNSENLQKCARFMQLKNTDMNVLTLCPKRMKNLESLFLFYSELKTLECNPTSMVFNNLHNVKINFCGFLEDLDFLACAPSLEYLFVANCRSLQRILCIMNNHIEKSKDVVPVISTLKQLVLINLPNLEIICNKPLTFPSLEIIRIQNCLKLQQNPFDNMVATNTNLREIIVQKKWWNSLKWKDDGRDQRYFLQYIH